MLHCNAVDPNTLTTQYITTFRRCFLKKRKNFILFLLDDNSNNNTGSCVESSFLIMSEFLIKSSNVQIPIILSFFSYTNFTSNWIKRKNKT